jgi:hypothetical protein
MRIDKHLLNEMDNIALDVFWGRADEKIVDTIIFARAMINVYPPEIFDVFSLIPCVAGWKTDYADELNRRHEEVRGQLRDYFADRRNVEVIDFIKAVM